MATPAFRAAGTAVFTANNVANPTALTPVKSGSTVNGDLMLCITESRSITATVATPSGWTLLTGFPVRSGTASGGSVYVFSRIADGTADDAPTITWTGLTTGTNGDSAGARIIAWQNAVAIQAGTVTSTDAAITTSATMPAITTTFGNALIVGIVVKINDTVHTWSVATRTERSDDHTTTGTGHGTVVADLVQTAVGASGTAAATPSTTVSSRSLAISIAMKPVIVTASVGQATETDTARRLAVPFGRATETDTARAIAVGGIDVGRVTETETAQALTHTKKRALGQASDTETARAVYASPYDATIDADSPISHWKLGETSGTTAFDRKGVSDGTLSNPTEYTLGQPGLATRNAGDKAILFQETGGTCGYITVFDPGAPYDVTRASLEAWVKLASDAAARSQRVVNGSSWKLEVSTARKARFYAKVGGVTQQVTGTTTLSLSTRYHLTGTYDGQFLRIYVNGALDGTLDLGVVADLDASTTVISISNLDPVFSWEGTADEVALYGSALALARIQAHFDAGGAVFLSVGRVTETDTAGVITPVQTSSGQTIAVGRASETDTAGATTARKTLALGQASDTETAGATGRLKTKAIGQASDAETAGAITRSKLKALGQASDTETAGATGRLKTKAIGQAADAETAGATTGSKRRAIAQASDAETAAALTSRKARAIAQATDTETAGATSAARVHAVAAAGETDTASAASRLKSRAVAQALEADTPAAIAQTKLRALAAALEADSASAASRLKSRATAAALEADSAAALAHVKLRELAAALEADSSAAVDHTKLRALGEAAETDTAPGVLRVAVTAAAETDAARVVVSQGHVLELGISVETDTAEAAARVKVKALLAAAETDTAPATGRVKLAGVALAEETSLAAALAVALAYAVNPALETDSALAASSGKATLVLYAAEANIAVAITPVGGATPVTDVRPTRGFVATIHEGTVSRAAPADSGIDAGLVARIRTGSVDQ